MLESLGWRTRYDWRGPRLMDAKDHDVAWLCAADLRIREFRPLSLEQRRIVTGWAAALIAAAQTVAS
jgi:hypothetical protein